MEESSKLVVRRNEIRIGRVRMKEARVHTSSGDSHGSLFPCKTGAPEFLAPELQGQSLAAGEWTANHDCFGLAVLIFQLLFLGRHPYAGTPLKGGDLQLPDAIENFRFAFSPDQSETQPPPGVPTLADLPPSIALAFQTAFQRDRQSVGRPSAAEWVLLLEEAKTDFLVCRSNPAHHYYRQATECPWCRMEAEDLQHLATIAADEKRRINELGPRKREAQLTRFLEEFRIDSAAVQHIGRSRRLVLASYGIETAADVTPQRLEAPGFGPTISEALLTWRRAKELAFKFDAGDSLDAREIARIQGDLSKAKANGVSAVRKRIRELDAIAESIRFHRRALHLELQGSYRELKQAEEDLSAVNSIFSSWEFAALALLFLFTGLGWFLGHGLHRAL